MDKLTIISGCLFLAADIFAIASIANPDWINTGESAGYILHEKRDVLCLTAVSQYPEECLAHRRHLVNIWILDPWPEIKPRPQQ
ncbi:modulator of smoothened protein isoform X5 [Ovis aries]|uniref:modulator of smoothened protein isoform X5 n=1 Tax=Ovis aries TaxID=9940 RepID=UPI00100F44D1|nr:modulator of smoothened protein isoform X5 [Ovis aries]